MRKQQLNKHLYHVPSAGQGIHQLQARVQRVEGFPSMPLFPIPARRYLGNDISDVFVENVLTFPTSRLYLGDNHPTDSIVRPFRFSLLEFQSYNSCDTQSILQIVKIWVTRIHLRASWCLPTASGVTSKSKK